MINFKGFVSSTSGNANVLGYNIRNPDHMNKIRQMTGVCPQNNILFDDLSVIEHLRVYAGIKNIVHSSVPDEVYPLDFKSLLFLLNLDFHHVISFIPCNNILLVFFLVVVTYLFRYSKVLIIRIFV